MTVIISLERVCDKICWGFRLAGGRDFGSPLTVSRIHAGSVAEKGGLKVGDIITDISDTKANQLTHSDAQRCIIDSGNSLKLAVLRGSSPDVQRAITPNRVSVTPMRAPIQDIPFLLKNVKAVSTMSVSSACSLYEDYSFELLDQTDDEFEGEYQEPTEEEIEEMLLENAEVLEKNGKNVIGVNFNRSIPQCEFIKHSAVFHVLQEEQVHKELSEREQLAKCPNKRFSTFLKPPNRPIPVQKRPPEKEKETAKPENPQCIDEPTTEMYCKRETPEYETVDEQIALAQCAIENNEKQQKQEEVPEKPFSDNFTTPENEVKSEAEDDDEIVETIQETCSISETSSNDFDIQLKNIKNTLNTLGELPSLIQSQLENMQSQINELFRIKSKQTNNNNSKENDSETKKSDALEEKNGVMMVSQTPQPIISECDEDYSSIGAGDEDDNTTCTEYDDEDDCNELKSGPVENVNEHGNKYQNNDTNWKEQDDDQTLRKRRICPLTPLPRPVVLPGGRVWRKPQDAFNEEFIAETLISQAEVLVGSTLGVNFRKYEPPKFDLSNSAVYKLIHNLESKRGGLENRDTIPALQDYYQSPISSRHFYCARLAENVHNPLKEDKQNEETSLE